MRRLLYIFLVFTFILTGSKGFAGHYRNLSKKNGFKISGLSLISNVNVSYERYFWNKTAVGFSYSFFYSFTLGHKYEPYIRYTFENMDGDGWYIEGRFAFGSFKNDAVYSKATNVYKFNSVTNSYEKFSSDFYLADTVYSFKSMGGSLLGGYRMFLKSNDRFFFDFSAGLQYFPFEEKYEADIEIEDDDDFRSVSYILWNNKKNKTIDDDKFWAYFGGGAFLHVKITFGIIF